LRAQRYIDKNCKDGSTTLKTGPPDQRTGGQQEYARDWRHKAAVQGCAARVTGGTSHQEDRRQRRSDRRRLTDRLGAPCDTAL